MNSFTIALIAFVCIFGGSLAGLFVQALLPDHHLRPESKDTVKLAGGLIATMAALVLGLLVSSAKNAYDLTDAEFVHMSAKIIMVDRLLAQYGPETKEARNELRNSLSNDVAIIWPDHNAERKGHKFLKSEKGMERFADKIKQLAPNTEGQRSILSQVTSLSTDVSLSRFIIIEQQENELPTVVLVVLIFWLSLLNILYGLFAPRNLTVVAVLLLCSMSVSASILLILEMDGPLDGLIQISSAPALNALKILGI